MPTYNYTCPVCGAIREEFHQMNENPEYVCDVCGKPLKRMVSGGTATLYKSPGFSQYKGRNRKI